MPLLHRELGVGDEGMPDERLERRDERGTEIGRRRDEDCRVRELGERPARAPNDAVDRGTDLPGQLASAFTRFTETLCSREPPPTENTIRASSRPSRETWSHAL